MATPQGFTTRSVPRSGGTNSTIFRDSNGLKNILHQNGLIIWILLSVSVHLLALTCFPGPRLSTSSKPNYLMVDLIYGVAASQPGPLLPPEPSGNKTNIGSGKQTRRQPESPALRRHPEKTELNTKMPTDISTPTPPVAPEPASKPQAATINNGMRQGAREELKAAPNTVEPQGSSPVPVMESQQGREGAVTGSPPNEGTGLNKGQSVAGNLAQGGLVDTGSPVDTPLAYGDNPPPAYPSTARRRGWEGEVRLLVTVTATGRVSKITIAHSSGYQILDRAAVSSVYRWRFQAAMRNGRKVPGQVMVPIRFSIKDSF